MDLRPIKENLTWPMKAAQYRLGVEGFMSYAIKTLTCDGKLRCPCMKCVNHKLLSPDDVNLHLLHFGMMHNYTIWIFHGEKVDPVPISSPSEPMVEDEILPYTDMRQLVHDTYGHRGDDPNISENGDQSTHGQNKEAQDFYTLLNDADTELWPGCELTKLSFLVLLFHIKSTNKWTNKSFNDLLGFCQLAIPNSANLPKSFAEAKKARFLYPKASEYWILKSVGFKWKDYKCYLKGKYYNDDEDITILHNRCPTDVDNNQWISLVNFWRSDEGQKRSKRGKESLAKAKAKPISTTGTKSHARVREELKQKLNRSPTRTELYLECHQHENEAEITGATILKLRRKLQEHLGSDFDDSEFDDLSDDLTESGSDGTDSNQEEDFDIPTIDKAVNKASSSGNDNSH
ncbi:hypothetical protein BVRB_6g128710 isoform A [Beta vulgaris subsp. vulgaris]|nr:hypothetical protein BVRB_6g128710 isoform A [Beta vulgaris subsp. vulgaris]